ncbi:MAG: flavodoxin domain-containing protein [Dehalococcoidales bacterium]|nr:flavodoxin domain-containing protein [Dehalococcoidales bacterium]
MESKILVAYGSKYGATAGIAQKIGETLQQEGLKVDILSAKKVTDISSYKAVVLGSAAYMFQWRKEVVKLLQDKENQLAEKPVWLFTSGPLEEGDPVKLLEGKIIPKALQPVLDRIKPRGITVFGGAIDLNKVNFFERFIFKRVKASSGDFRNWDTITTWAKSIANTLKNPA